MPPVSVGEASASGAVSGRGARAPGADSGSLCTHQSLPERRRPRIRPGLRSGRVDYECFGTTRMMPSPGVQTSPDVPDARRAMEDRFISEWGLLANAWGVSPLLGRIHG